MYGLDQVVVTMWFFPVVLFILMPLCMTLLWGVVSVFGVLFRPVAGQEVRPAEVSNSRA